MVDLAREFKELKSFAQKFGGERFTENPRFASIINEIELGFTNRNVERIDDNLKELSSICERFLPITSRAAVVEAIYDDDKLILSGAVQKTLSFREDLYVNIYDQRGELIEEVALKDNSSGLFTEVVSGPFDPGLYVAQLQYHDVVVTDFFNVK